MPDDRAACESTSASSCGRQNDKMRRQLVEAGRQFVKTAPSIVVFGATRRASGRRERDAGRPACRSS
jgi:hypothetical protein